MRRVLCFSAIALCVLLPIATWNHRIAPLPPDVRPDLIVPGVTTLAEAKQLLGVLEQSDQCMKTLAWRTLASETWAYGRGTYIEVQVSLPSSPQDIFLNRDAGIVRRVEIAHWSRLRSWSDHWWERWPAYVLEWEYALVAGQ